MKAASKKQPADLVAALKEGLPSARVFEAFEALDSFPPSDVRAALSTWTGPAPSLDALTDPLRASLGLAPKAPSLRCTRHVRHATKGDLTALDREQIRRAGQVWDEQDLDASVRLASRSEGSLGDAVELISFSDAHESARFDVVRFDKSQGTVFAAGTTKVLGVLADGGVDLSPAELRHALQIALAGELKVVERKRAEAPKPKLTVEKEAAPTEHRASVEKTKAAKKKKVVAETKEKATSKKKAAAATTKTATKKAAAKSKAVAKVAPKKKAAAATAKTATKKKAAATAKAVAKVTSKKKAAAATSKTATKKKAVAKVTSKKKAAAATKTATKKKAAAATKTATKKKAAKSKTVAKVAPKKKATAKKKTSARR